jgi:hypothetical protein
MNHFLHPAYKRKEGVGKMANFQFFLVQEFSVLKVKSGIISKTDHFPLLGKGFTVPLCIG